MTARRARAGHAEVTASIKDRISGGLKRIKAKMTSFAATSARIGGVLTGSAAGSALALVPLVRTFAEFDDQMRTVKAVTNATDAEFARLAETARELGRSTSFTASEVAGAQVALGRAGFKPAEIDESIASVLALARATGTELPEAAQIGADVLRSFKLESSDMSKVADVLTVTANSSSQTLTDLFESLKTVAPIAAEAGDGIEDLAAASGVLANNGIKGSLASNSLARAYKNLANSARQAKLKELAGVDAVDAEGNLKPLVQIIQDLGSATEGFGEAARLDAFEQLFGRGQVAALNLANANSGFDELRQKLSDVNGAAIETANEMDSGLGGSIRKLWSALEGVGLTIADALVEPLTLLGNGAVFVASKLQAIAEKNPNLIRWLLAGVAAAGLAGTALLGMAGLGLIASGAISFISGAAALATGAISVLGAGVGIVGALIAGLASPIGLVAALLIGGGAAWLKYSDQGNAAITWVSDRLGQLLDWGKMVFGGVYDAIVAGDWQLAGEIMWNALKVAWMTGIGTLNGLWVDFKFGMISAFDLIVTSIRKAWNTGITAIAEGILWLIEQANIASEALTGAKLLETEGIRQQLRQDNARFQEKASKQQLQREQQRIKQIDEAKKRFDTKDLQRKLKQQITLARQQAEAIQSESEKQPEPSKRKPLTQSDRDNSPSGNNPTSGSSNSLGSFSLSALSAFARNRNVEEQNAESNRLTAENTEEMVDIIERLEQQPLTVTA